VFRVFSCVLLAACLVSCVVYSRSPDGSISRTVESSEPISYSLSLSLFSRPHGIVSAERAAEESSRYRELYASFTPFLEAALRRAGFADPVASGNPRQTDAGYRIAIHVEETRWRHYALPQEWLTGLSLGLIPSWGTRQEWSIRFELSHSDAFIAAESYTIQFLTVSHLLLIPAAYFQSADEDLAQVGEALEHFLSTSLR
jgi:hypothetical protein